MQQTRLRAYAVEVAEPEKDVRRHAYEVVRSRERYRPIEAVDLQTERFAAEADEADATEESYYLDQVRLHAFAGLPFVGRPNDGELIPNVLTQREAVEADGLTFRCETTRMAAGDRVITIRTGVAEEFLSSSDAYRSEGSTERRAAYRRQHSSRGQRPIRSESVEVGRDLAVVTAADGCMLAVSFEDR